MFKPPTTIDKGLSFMKHKLSKLNLMTELFILLPLSLIALSFSLTAHAADLTVQVSDSTGVAVKNAVVYLESDIKSNGIIAPAMIAQRGKKFDPLVSVVQVGSEISFPNYDSVRHQVYSFSPAKTFELKLYSGTVAKTVKFDKAGTVVLGCNIHDFMLAFIQVVDTPYFTKSDDSGKAKLTNIPEGNYQLKVWHYALAKEKEIVQQPISIKGNDAININLNLKPFALPSVPQ